MNRPWKRIALAGLALAGALLLGGCSAPSSAEELFTLPQLPLEYSDLSRQINALIEQGYEYASPTGGRNIQSVQMVDLDGDGDEEAVAFFRRSTDEKPLKIIVFSANGEKYERFCTIESSGTAVESVYYQDLTGDKQLEMVVGWRIAADVQTVAAYSVQKDPKVLMQSGYVRYSLEDLNGDGMPSLLVFHPDDDGNSVAEFYSWQDETLSVSYSATLSGTMVDLTRGNVVSGRMANRRAAVYVTGVTEDAQAVTDIITFHFGRGLINVALDPQTGSSGAVFPYAQLRPQDINVDGVVEVPAPKVDREGQPTGIVDWMAYDGEGRAKLTMTTYHNLSGGWFFTLPKEWHGRVTVTTAERNNEIQTIFSVNGRDVGVIYTLVGENRENRALRGNRQVIKRQPGTVYAGEVLPDGAKAGLTDVILRQNFNLISNEWITG